MKEVNHIISIGDCCVVAELLNNNNARINFLGYGYIFDWANSNIDIVCDIVENGYEWHIENNIKNGIDPPDCDEYPYAKLGYKHHEHGVLRGDDGCGWTGYKESIAKRFFKLLNNTSGDNVIFTFMTHKEIPLKGLLKLVKLLKKKHKQLSFKIVAANSIEEGSEDDLLYKDSKEDINHIKINEHLDVYKCRSPQKFYINTMKGHDFYKKLFNTLFPYEINIKNIDDQVDKEVKPKILQPKTKLKNEKKIILNYIKKHFGSNQGHYSYCMFPEEDCSCKRISNVTYETSLIRGGYIDSFSMVVVLVFLEETFNVKIPNSRATADNFDTVNSMVKLLYDE